MTLQSGVDAAVLTATHEETNLLQVLATNFSLGAVEIERGADGPLRSARSVVFVRTGRSSDRGDLRLCSRAAGSFAAALTQTRTLAGRFRLPNLSHSSMFADRDAAGTFLPAARRFSQKDA